MEKIREPLIMFTPDLRIITGNRSFYEMFHVTPQETKGRFVYSIGSYLFDITVFPPRIFSPPHFFYCKVMDFLLNYFPDLTEWPQ